ncbi:MAG TPA: hypothetical protein H9898_05130 [Candidatus Anaerobiospirillum stercoravium]|nr:hypothetical protein [Candidatus Anaerobiospirillum stercoravium]
MKKSVLSILCAGAMMLSVTACSFTAPINEYGGSIPVGVTSAEVKQVIKDAGAKRDWIVKDMGNGVCEATYIARGHQIVVKVTYDKDSYEISYVSSQGMKVDTQEGTIHRNYNRWVNNLKHDIDLGLLQAEAR